MDFDRADKNLYLTMRVTATEIEERDMMFNDLYIEQLNKSRHSLQENVEGKLAETEPKGRKSLMNLNFHEFD